MRGMSTVPQRAVAVTTVLLVLAIVAVLLLRSLGVQLAVGPLASPTPPVATATPQPTPVSSADALAVFAQIEQQVSDLRDLPAPDIGPPDVITRDELAVELNTLFDETWTDEQLAADNLTLRAMGLLTEDQDIRELTEQLYAGQVLGFYDFEDQRMVVVTDAGLTAEAQITYAHEFTHAMQDAAFDTGAFHDTTAEDDDTALARLALEEGDATVAMFQWAFANLAPDELGGIGATPLPDMSGIPNWMVQQLEFPYLAGSTWVSGPVVIRRLGRGGCRLRPAAGLDGAGAAPGEVRLRRATGGGGRSGRGNRSWAAAGTAVESSTVGEAMLGIWLGAMGVSQSDADVAAAGWGGDRLSVASGPNDEWGMAWRIAWDTPAETDEFDEAYGEITADLPFPTRSITASNGDTLILHASSAAVLDRMAARAGRLTYIDSGAVMPSNPSPLASTVRVASVRARRASESGRSAGSSERTRQSR